MATLNPAQPWTGRTDGPGPEHRRWHSTVHLDPGRPTMPGIALLGFKSDEGVRRNGGRPGAATGPDAIRRALAPLALNTNILIRDLGDIELDGRDLEGGQDALGAAVARALSMGETPVVLGGGHETAYGSYLGLRRSGLLEGRTLGILNLDAHFDLREAQQPTSGTPFLQIAKDERQAGRQFAYAVVGISQPSNTPVLFDTAAELSVAFHLDADSQERHTVDVLEFVQAFIDRVDILYLTVDLDVLPAAAAPGVSAPAALGVPPSVVLEVCRLAAAANKFHLLDVVELNPTFDRDHQTAAIAARIIHTVTTAASSRRELT